LVVNTSREIPHLPEANVNKNSAIVKADTTSPVNALQVIATATDIMSGIEAEMTMRRGLQPSTNSSRCRRSDSFSLKTQSIQTPASHCSDTLEGLLMK